MSIPFPDVPTSPTSSGGHDDPIAGKTVPGTQGGSGNGGGSGGGSGHKKKMTRSRVVNIIVRVAKELGIPPILALATAYQESGLNPHAVGDHGTSFGIFQLHEGGELGSNSADWAYHVENNARRALGVMAKVYAEHPDWSWGAIAAAAQRPADQAGYAQSVNGIVSQSGHGTTGIQYFATHASIDSGAGSGGVGGAGSGAAPQNNVHVSASDLAKRYGFVGSFLADHQAIDNLVQKAAKGGWSDETFWGHFQGTPFYKNHTRAQETWLLFSQNPDNQTEVQSRIAARVHDLRQQAHALGLNLTPEELHNFAEKSLLNGFSDQQIAQGLAAHLTFQQAQNGTAGTTEDQLRAQAADYGINLSDHATFQWAKNLLTGNASQDNYTTYVQGLAASAFPGLAKQIEQGQTVRTLADPYVQSMAGTLEINPNTIDFSKDPLIRKAFSWQANDKAPPTTMPLWEFDQHVKSDPRWLQTDNARNSLTDVTTGILQQWGVLA